MFRYVLRPHAGFDATEASRFATGFSQPLVVRPASGDPVPAPFTLESNSINVLAFKPADDGDGYVMTLYNPGHQSDTFTLLPKTGAKVHSCDTGENRLRELSGPVELGGQEVVSVRFR